MNQPVKSNDEPKGFYIKPLAPYEDRLLNALAFFRTQRQPTIQAHHCLSMYLRQSESRIMSEISFYARMVNLDKHELLELIYTDPDRAEQLIAQATGVKPSEVFETQPE